MTPFGSTPHTIPQNARALLAGLRIESWSARKYDADVSKAAAAHYGADEHAGRFNKSLIPSTTKVHKVVEETIKRGKNKGQKKTKTIEIETNSHIELMAHLAEIRQFYYRNTLEWQPGWRVLPIANWTEFITGWRERLARFDRLLPVFIADYPHLVERARALLNGMFKEKDYPTDIAKEFSLRIEWDEMPGKGSGDIRVDLAQEDIDMITSSVEARCQEGWKAAANDCVVRLYKSLKHIHDRLTATRVSTRKDDKGETIGATYRDTLVQNARDLCDVLTRLNVADDAKLEQFRRETELLAAVEPETLRDSPDLATETAQRADDILKRMTQAYGADLFQGLK